MDTYTYELEKLDERLGMYPEENLALLDDYRGLAERARNEGTLSAGEALLTIAYTIGERISADEDLEPYYRDALKILEQHRTSDTYFAALDSIAWHLMNKDRTREALLFFERVIREKSAVSDQVDYFSLSNLALAYERIGELEKALAAREQALDAWTNQEIVPGTPDVAFYAQARTEMGRILSQVGKHQQAESHFRSVFDDNRRSYGALTPFGRWHQAVIDSALDLVSCLVQQKKLSEAEEVIVGEMPESFEGLDEMSRMFAAIAHQCYQQALRDLRAGEEPSIASRPGTLISKGFQSEHN